MKKVDNNFTNLSYQDFYEDKILLIEYDMAPYELKNNNILVINNQVCYYHYWFEPKNQLRFKYKEFVLIIIFNLQDTLKPFHKMITNKLSQQNCWSVTYGISDEGLRIGVLNWDSSLKYKDFYIYYTHNVKLSWEEITDESYLNFIIDSTIISLNQKMEECAFKKQFKNYKKEDLKINIRVVKYL